MKSINSLKHQTRKHYYKEELKRIKIGREISNSLPKKLTKEAVAKIMGISKSLVDKIECLALYKLRNLTKL